MLITTQNIQIIIKGLKKRDQDLKTVYLTYIS